MTTTTIRGRIVTPTGPIDGRIVLEDGRISRIDGSVALEGDGAGVEGKLYDFGRSLVVPGFIDVHMHGLGEHGVTKVDGLVGIARMQAQFGTTGFLPGIASLTVEQCLQFGRNLLEAQKAAGPDSARIIGAHYEGPFINPVARAGMDEAYLRPVDLDECQLYIDQMGDALKLMTISPELPGSEDLIRLLRRNNTVVSIGHSRATKEQLDRAIAAGLTQVCHLYNAFERAPGRENWPWAPGLLDHILASDRLDCEVICDMRHVPPEFVKLAIKSTGPNRFLAITDSMRGAGLPPAKYVMMDGREFSTENGIARLTSDGTIVGSIITLSRAFGNLVEQCDVNLADAARFTATNPARAIGVGDRTGSIEPGKQADLAVLDDQYNCIATFIDGRPVHGI